MPRTRKKQTTKKPSAKKLARVLDKAYSRSLKTGNTARIDKIVAGVEGNRKYTKSVLKEAVQRSNKIIGPNYSNATRATMINSVRSDMAFAMRAKVKRNYIRELWSVPKQAAAKSPVKQIKSAPKTAPKTAPKSAPKPVPKTVSLMTKIGRVGSAFGGAIARVAPWVYAAEIGASGVVEYAKTGDVNKAANASANTATFGLYKPLKADYQRPESAKQKDRVNNAQRLNNSRDAAMNDIRAALAERKNSKSTKARSVQGELQTNKKRTATKSDNQIDKAGRKAAKSKKRAGRTFKRTRIVNGKRVKETVRNYRYKS